MNKTIFRDGTRNAIRFSEFTKIDAETPFAGIGVKYVASGVEEYIANNRRFVVREGEYIIGNDFTSTIVHIDQKQTVQGLCIDISPDIVNEVAEYHDLNHSDLKEFLLSDQFFVNRYNVKNTSLGYSLVELNQKIKSGDGLNDFLQEELFYSLAESIITDQRFVFHHLNKMNFKKARTNEDVFRQLLKGKDLIDEHCSENISLAKICSGAGISRYHFIRLFKNIFGISPYQYQKRKRLDSAKTGLIHGCSVSEVALSCGYPDASSFSKAFKQVFGQYPGSFARANSESKGAAE